MSKKVKGKVSETKKVKDDIQVVVGEIHLLIYQVSKTEEKILSASRERLVPLLTKALQEAITKIETLEAKVAVLEG